jgi:hypothetical protein
VTALLRPPELGAAVSLPLARPHPFMGRPGRGILLGAAAALVATFAAAVIAGVSLARPSTSPVNTVITPWAPATPSAPQVAAARTQACKLWGITASAMDDATNAVAAAPADWNNPATQEALTNEARVILVESVYLRREVPHDAPAEIRTGINDYLAASFDMENATAHRQGTARDAAIDRANAAEDIVNTACQ